MTKIILIGIITILGLAIIIEIIARIYIYQGKKMNVSATCYDALMQMLSLKRSELEAEKEKVQFIEAKKYYYHPLQKIIALNDYASTTIYAHLASLHEGGHYRSASENKQKEKMIQFSTIIIAFNRLIVIPYFIIITYMIDFENVPSTLFINVSTAFIIFFIFATILRFIFGLPEEYRASQIALEYIGENYDQKVLKFSKSSYRTFFLQYFFHALLFGVSIPFIYCIIFLIGSLS
ncbi:zinc metallopeptidase [Amphibacillus indicireducens]|uniref:Peptidase n=1 Tax=Amphibacillus indicireducens TaxID=1076330 RepID=A0ABP7VVE2_9BACI